MVSLKDIVLKIKADASQFEKEMEKAQKTFNNFGDKIKGAGETMSKTLTTSMGALGGLAIKSSLDSSNAMINLQNQLGLTGEEAEKLQKTAKNVWKAGFGADLNEVSMNLATLKQNLGDMPDSELENVSKQAMTLSQTLGEDVGVVSKTASIMMKEFGMSAEEAFDMMAAGQQNGLNKSGDLLDTLAEYGPNFRDLGFSASDMLNMMSSGLENGAFNTDFLADSMREFGIRATESGGKSADAFAALGLNVEATQKAFSEGGEKGKEAFKKVVEQLSKVEDGQLRNQMGIDLFGTKWEDLGERAILSMAGMKTEIKDIEGATQKMTENVEKSFGQEFQGTMRTLMDALEPIGLIILDMVKDVLPFLKELAEWFQNLSPPIQKLIVVIGGILAVIGPVLVVVGTIISSIGTVIGVFGGLSAVLSGVAAAFSFLLGPIGLIIIAVAGVAYLIYKYWDEIKVATEIAFKAIWEAIKKVFEWIVEGVKLYLELFFTVWKTILQGIADFFVMIWDGIVAAFNFYIGLWKTYFETLMSIGQWFVDTFKLAISTFVSFWVGVWDSIVSVFTTVITKITEFTTMVYTKFEEFKAKLTEIFLLIKDIIVNSAVELWTSVSTKFQEGVDLVLEKLEAFKTKITEIKDWVFGEAKSIGSNIVEGITSGLSNFGSAISEKIGSLTDKGIIGMFKKKLDIHSPSRVFKKLTGFVVDGAVEGIENKEGNLMAAMSGMAGGLENAFNPQLSTGFDINSSLKELEGSSTAFQKVQQNKQQTIILEGDLGQLVSKVKTNIHDDLNVVTSGGLTF